MSFYRITFDRVEFPSGEKTNYNLTASADSAEEMQENSIELIESMGGKHGNIIELKKVNDAPLAGIGPIDIA